jgi:lysophospholipase L1-like esterase
MLRVLCLLTAASIFGLPARAQQRPFEAEIRAFERLDSLQKPAPGQILLYGSSSMRLWSTFAEDLAGYAVVNRGFGGSEMSDAVFYFDRVVAPLRPAWILLYEGDNDLANGETPERVLADFKALMDLVHQKLPGTRIALYTLRPSAARQHLLPQQRQLNHLFRKYARRHRDVYLVDVHTLLLGPDGRANPAYLAEDKLHLNTQGYGVWAEATRAFLKKYLR